MEQSQIQMKLRSQGNFLQRLEYALVTQANVVMGEANTTTNHSTRVTYAKYVLASPAQAAQAAADYLAGSTNIVAATTYDSLNDVALCSATDAAFLSQVATLWDKLSGVSS